jgi:hypothetical protein
MATLKNPDAATMQLFIFKHPLKTGQGLDEVVRFIEQRGLLTLP